MLGLDDADQQYALKTFEGQKQHNKKQTNMSISLNWIRNHFVALITQMFRFKFGKDLTHTYSRMHNILK